MKKLALLFLWLLFAGVMASCGEELDNGWRSDPNPSSPTYTVKEHIPLILGLTISCPYDSACSAALGIGQFQEKQTREIGGITYVAYDCAYTLKMDSTSTLSPVTCHSTVGIPIHDDGHVYFSLFDSTGAEKSYDVDLSGTIHSWTRRGDSVDVVIPEGFLMSAEKKGEPFWLGFIGDTLPNRTAALSFDGTWNSFYYLEAGKSKQSSYETDSIHISSIIHWCSNPNPMYAYYCQD